MSAPAAMLAGLGGRSVVLVGLMGAGKSSIGRRLAQRLGLPFQDADSEIEAAAGMSIPEIFSRLGEPAFRDGERRVIARLLQGPPVVLATGGGAYVDPATRAAVRERGVAVWLKADLGTLLRRVSSRNDRPLLKQGEPAEVMARLAAERNPIYAEADIAIESSDEPPEVTTGRVAAALDGWRPGSRTDLLRVNLAQRSYDIVVGGGLLARAGAYAAPLLRQKRVVVIADARVADLHLPALQAGLAAADIATHIVPVRPGEASKDFTTLARVVDEVLDAGVERRSCLVALGGGVIGDLAGFAAAITLRGIEFMQVPTTLLAQVDSSVGGKTGINTRHGKNLVGSFHQPRLVLADTDTLATLPPRELRAGYAEVVKYGLLGDARFFDWCEANAARVLAGQADAQREAIRVSCAMKAAIVAEDERESADKRALLNLGHTFGHALEAETGYGDALLHGEAVAVGMGLAFALSARLGHGSGQDTERTRAHLARHGLPARRSDLPRRFSAEALLGHMRHDKKVTDGRLTFVLARGIGQAFVSREVGAEAVRELLREEGCEA
ncbi:MAG: 3-dehydroquinate synthase [Alphaproteobacteria bacterium]|nr:3-dehydroquinate synthase [Alphaproteobacteria bacterium]